MTEKKATKTATTKAAAEKKTTCKKTTTTRKAAVKTVTVDLSAENVGFRAGDVYQVLHAAEKSLSVAEVAKAASISTEDTLLGIGWLLKEGKVKAENGNITLA